MAKSCTIDKTAEWLKGKACLALPFGKRSVHLAFSEGEYTYHAFVHDSNRKLAGDLLIDTRYLNPMGYPSKKGRRIFSVVQMVVFGDQCAVTTPSSMIASQIIEDNGLLFYSIPDDLYAVHSMHCEPGQLFDMCEVHDSKSH